MKVKLFITRLAFLILLVLPICAKTEPLTTACPGLDVRIEQEAKRPKELALICQGARRAIEFLDGIAVHQQTRLTIHVTQNLPHGLEDAIGCYDWDTQVISVMPLHTCMTEDFCPKVFRDLDQGEIYQSFVAHEVAHAIAAANFEVATPSLTSQEYISAVAQMASLPPELRTKILARVKSEGFEGADRINLLLYQFDPVLFLVESYRHYRAPGNGPEFIHALLSGEIRLSDVMSY